MTHDELLSHIDALAQKGEQIAQEIEAMGECACEIDETDGEIVSPCWRCIHAAIARGQM